VTGGGNVSSSTAPPPATAAAGDVGGGVSAAFDVAEGAPAVCGSRPDRPVLKPKKYASPSAASSPTKSESACLAVKETW
jgi:hypothetical protein